MPAATACWNCGFENQPDAKFCANCGKAQRQPCPECGADVPEASRFCPNCGIALATRTRAPSHPVLTAETRRVITVLFADLVGSTGLTERLDPEEARDVIKKFYDVAEDVVERWYQGSIANYLGDGVLAVFGLPAAHENDPERAARAGLAIRDAMPNLNEHLRATHGIQLAVRIGINTGEVVASSGSTFERDFLVSDAVTTAARLQQTVPAGTVVVGERTYRLTKESIEYHELPPMAVKGKEGSVAVWAAVAPLPEPVEIRRIAAPLVGRHAELGLLRHLYERSRDESLTHLVTLLGQPGVGKSRLLREFLAEVRETENPPLVLRGRSAGFGGQIGYHALLDILRGQAGLLDTDLSEVVRTKIDAWIREVLPQSGELLDGLLLTFGTSDAGDDPGLMRQRLFTSWKELILGLASTRPVVLALEDLHWADDGVLDLIQTMTDGTAQAALFIICLARTELMERRPAWPGSRRNTTGIELRPLRPLEAEHLAASLSSEALAPDVRRMVAQRAGGNPLFVEELIRMLLEDSTPGAAIPDTVQAVITARIDRLPLNERRTLQAAAVIGRSFWPSAVAPIAGLSLEEVSAAIEGLIRSDLAVALPRSVVAGEREFAFRHILTRDVAYAMLPRAQRQRAHAEAARWLEARAGDRVEEVVEILAEHLRLAGDHARAAVYLHRAGNKARRLYANADAIRLFDQALEAATEAGLGIEQRGIIYRDRGEVHQLRGDYASAMADFTEGLAIARQVGDRRLEAILENRVGFIFHRQHRLEDAEQHFRRAAALARQIGDVLTLGQTLVDLANIDWDRGRMPPDHPAIVEGLDLLRQASDQASVARALNMLSMSHLRAGDWRAGLQAADEGRDAAHAAGDKSREATSISYLSNIHGYFGQYRDALEHGATALALAREIEDHRRAGYTLFFLTRAAHMLGQWGDAHSYLNECLPLMQTYASGHVPWPLLYSALLKLGMGDVDGAKDAFRNCARLDPAAVNFWQPIAISRLCLALLNNDETMPNTINGVAGLPWREFMPGEAEAILLLQETLAYAPFVPALNRFIDDRRPTIQHADTPPQLAMLAILDAQSVIHQGDRDQALPLLDQAIRWSREAECVVTERRARELKFGLTGADEDREALRNLLDNLADSLPTDLRAPFLASPRVAGVLERTT